MDEKDLRILKTMADLETTSIERVSEATDVPISTIHYRLNNLREEGVIANDRLDVDLDELGLDVTILVEVFLKDDRYHEDSGRAIADIEGVTKVFFTMGGTDFIALARLSNSNGVERLVSDFEELDAVARTDSTFVIDRELDSDSPLQEYSIETLVSELVDD